MIHGATAYQPMSTAPKDGAPFRALVRDSGGERELSFPVMWDTEKGAFVDAENSRVKVTMAMAGWRRGNKGCENGVG